MTAATFGQFVEAARQRARLTQDALGIAVGCSRTYLSHLESDEGVPSASLLVRLSDKLKVDLGTLTRLAGALQDQLSSAAPRAAS